MTADRTAQEPNPCSELHNLRGSFSQRGVFVGAGCAVGATTGSELDLAQLEVLLELLPLVFRGLAVFRRRADGTAGVEEGAIAVDQFALEDREIRLRGVDVVVAEDLRGDVDRESSGDGVRDEHSAEVMRRVAQRLASAVGESCPLDGVVEQGVEHFGADDFPAPAHFALEQVR